MMTITNISNCPYRARSRTRWDCHPVRTRLRGNEWQFCRPVRTAGKTKGKNFCKTEGEKEAVVFNYGLFHIKKPLSN